MLKTKMWLCVVCLLLLSCGDDDKPDDANNGNNVNNGNNANNGNNVNNVNSLNNANASTNNLNNLNNLADMGSSDMGSTDMEMVDQSSNNAGSLYVGSGDPYALGALQIDRSTVAEGTNGAPLEYDLYSPREQGEYAVVVFQHGFLLRNSYYSDILTHLASHGFVVVAPQMYEPSFFGAPSTAEEAQEAESFYAWVAASIQDQVNVDAAADKLGVAGHSRGAKVLYLTLEGGFEGVLAVAGVDPVDGTGGPFGGEARVLADGLSVTVPSLIVGAGRSSEQMFGQACAPVGDDHAAFFAGAPAPAYYTLATAYGHLDMLDTDRPGCGITCTACVEGPADGGMRQLVGGQLAAFFRSTLQGDAGAVSTLTDANAAPVAVTTNSK